MKTSAFQVYFLNLYSLSRPIKSYVNRVLWILKSKCYLKKVIGCLFFFGLSLSNQSLFALNKPLPINTESHSLADICFDYKKVETIIGEDNFYKKNSSFSCTSGNAIAAQGAVRNGVATNATGVADGTTTEIGAVGDYLVLTLNEELPIGTDYTIHISGRGGATTTDVWEAPTGTALPTTQQNAPTGFTQNGQASSGASGAMAQVIKTTIVATKYLYLDRGSGDIEIDAVTYCLSSSFGSTYPPADYTIDSGGTVNTCSGVFADSGDTNGEYSDSESQTMTFCSDQNNHISFTFEHFNTEIGSDILTIYDGNSTGATSLGNFSGFGTANSPGVVTSSGTCLTFAFASNGSTVAPGWLASISCTGIAPTTVTAGSWTGYPTGSACSSTTQLGGKIYEDIDQDGIEDDFEPPLYGINVYLFDDNGQVGSPTTTDVNGEYTFSGLTTSTIYRVEFEVPSNWKEGPYNAESGTSVQFVAAGRCDANLGLIDIAHYCGEVDPYWVIPCYNTGDPQHSSNINGTGVARFKYSDSGDSPTSTYTNYVTLGAVGSTWGGNWSIRTAPRLRRSHVSYWRCD